MSDDLNKIRNIGIIAHIDAGKTTVTERVLYYTGRTYKMGEVHDGTAVMDYLEEEQKRGITITSAATKCPWEGFDINLIDTPGHIDFTAEVERSLRVLDGAVVVFDGSEGVQAQSETVWRQSRKYDLPCLLFINKLDKLGADFQMSVDSIRNKLSAHPIVLQIPIGEGDAFAGIIDLVKMRAIFYNGDKLGASFEECEIPRELRRTVEQRRHDMIELASEHDEVLMDLYVHNKLDKGFTAPATARSFAETRENAENAEKNKPADIQVIERAIRKGTLSNRLQPVFCGSALKYIGIQRLLDGVVSYLPSPLDKPPVVGYKPASARTRAGRGLAGGGPDDEEKKVTVKCDRSASLVALAFKIISEPHGDLYFLRIYQGMLKSGSRVLNTTRDKRENIVRIFEMHANERQIRQSAGAGDIVAVIGPKETITGDTLCDTRKPVCLPSITFPQTVITMSIEPKSSADRVKLGEALAALRREDPTFEVKVDTETGQTVISGMGELHLEILQHKLIRDRGVDIRVGRPRVAYKEAITRQAEAEGKFIRQTGGRGQYGHVVLEAEPLVTKEGHLSMKIEFVNRAGGDRVPREYVSAVEKGIRDALSSGVLAGYPVVGVRVTLIDGSYHTVDSSDIAFEQAGAAAISGLLEKAQPMLLEPVMRLEVEVPESYFGVVQAGLLAKRGLIIDSNIHSGIRVIDAKVPLSEMFGYSSEIRSVTAGRGSFTMEPMSYERVPEQVAKQILLKM